MRINVFTKFDLLEDLYRNVSTELALASKEDFIIMILSASPSSVMTNDIYFRLKTVEFIYRCFHGPNAIVSNKSHLCISARWQIYKKEYSNKC